MEEAEGEEAAQEMDESPSPEVESNPPADNLRARSSDEMFAEIGAQLRERRETLNLTREEIERHIHLRAHYLQALERGDFGGLPSAVQTRGMLSNYAAFLDLDVDALLLNFADVLQVWHRERHPLPPGARGRPAPSAPASVPPLRGFMVADFAAIGLVLAIIVFSVWGVQYVIKTGAQVEATAPPMIDVLLEPSLAPLGTFAPTSELLDLGNVTATLAAFETPAGLPTIPEGVNVQINIIAIERTYLRVTSDGEVVFDGRVTPGTAYPFEAANEIEILAGNGAALRVTYNLRDMGLLGRYGEVVNLIYRTEGVITPTATIGPTPTITLTPTLTPTPTQTATPTRTPAP
ncbi:MAG: helix-turn-helix domain-containing protein [Anaerolineaceae bacterium]|nr:MAG: helix-turn-helix domain-containing protein [Anaerolineaceae bacterium]